MHAALLAALGQQFRQVGMRPAERLQGLDESLRHPDQPTHLERWHLPERYGIAARL